MRILSHRGWWVEAAEKNTTQAFERSFAAGFGTELDIRDCAGRLVVSHDPADEDAPLFEEVLALRDRVGPGLPLAINVKADGLQGLIATALEGGSGRGVDFVFDMSIPDTLGYRAAGMPYFSRQSEFEQQPPLYEDAAGVWLDCFQGEWFGERVVEDHIAAGKRVCMVSPELHGRERRNAWETWAAWGVAKSGSLALCTDHPDEARETFMR